MPHRPSEAGLARGEDRDQRHAERGGEMDEPGIHADDEGCPRDERRHAVERLPLGRAGIRQRRSDTLAARVLGLGPPWQQERTAAPAQRTTECNPRRLRPFLFGPRSRMKQYAVRLSGGFCDCLTRKPEIDGATGGITEREAGQHAIARDGMEVARDAMLNIVEPRRRSLTNAVRVVAVPAAASEPRHQRGAHEPLGVDDIVVAARPKLAISRTVDGASGALRQRRDATGMTCETAG